MLKSGSLLRTGNNVSKGPHGADDRPKKWNDKKDDDDEEGDEGTGGYGVEVRLPSETGGEGLTGIDRDVLVREVARPVRRRLLSQPQLDPNLKILLLQDLRGPLLVNLLRLAVDQELEFGSSVLRDERDGDLGRVDGEVEGGGVANGAEDATPVGVFAVEGGFDEGGG